MFFNTFIVKLRFFKVFSTPLFSLPPSLCICIYMVGIVLRYLSILVWFYLLQSFHLGTLQVRWKFYDQFTSSSEEVSVTNSCQFHSVFETLRRKFLRILWSHKLYPSRNWISLALKIFFLLWRHLPHTAFFYLYPFSYFEEFTLYNENTIIANNRIKHTHIYKYRILFKATSYIYIFVHTHIYIHTNAFTVLTKRMVDLIGEPCIILTFMAPSVFIKLDLKTISIEFDLHWVQ